MRSGASIFTIGVVFAMSGVSPPESAQRLDNHMINNRLEGRGGGVGASGVYPSSEPVECYACQA
jgi:hypothetical protein